MGKFEGILICTDLDGTLLRNDRSVSSKNLDAIEYFKSEGGAFTFITGRMPHSCRKIYETLKPNVPFGCINGGGIYDHIKGEYVWTKALDPTATELVRHVDKALLGIGIEVCTFDKIYFSRDNEATENVRKVTGCPHIVKDYEDVDEPIAKVIFADTDEERLLQAAKILREHPRSDEFDFIRSELTLYEILPKGISKGNVLTKLAEHLNIPMSKTVALGDYNNDVSMIRAAGLGIAVSNASEEALRAADIVTVSNDEDAIARVINELETGKIKI